MSLVVAPSPRVAPPREIRTRATLSALAIQPAHLVSLLLCALVFHGWLCIECATPTWRSAVFFGLLVLSVYYLGRLVLRLVPLETNLSRSFALLFLTGSLSWALTMLALHSLLPGSLSWQMLILFALSAVGQFVIHRRERPAYEERGAALVSVFVVLFSLAAATCWARGLLHSIRFVGDRVEFHHWVDYFDHAAFTSQLLAPEHLWGFGNYEIGRLPTPLYHYGSYLFTASLASFGQLSAYDAVISLWTPLGTFLGGLAAYVLALSFGGRPGGLCALVAVLTLPDASYYGFRNPWFRYHWLQQIGSAGLYGTTCAALALVFLLEARRSRSWRALAAGLMFAAATFWFKAQLFVVLMPLLIAWLILCYPRFSVVWRIGLLGCVVVTALGATVVSNRLHLGPHLAPDREYFEHYCKYVASEGGAGRLRTLVENGAAEIGRSRYYLAGTSLIVLSTFGVLVGALPLLSLWAWWRKKLHAADLVPWLAAAVYVALLVGLKDNIVGVHWYEIIHRPFVWAYFVMLVWCAGKVCVLVHETRFAAWLVSPRLIAVAGLLLLALPWRMGLNVQQGRMSWRSRCYGCSFPHGLVECGRYVADSATRTDLVQDAHYDESLVFGSLSERRSYLARPTLWKRTKNSLVPAEIERRYALLERFKTLTTVEQIRQVAAQTGIRWYLLHPEDRLAWPREILDHPTFFAEGFAVYDLSQLANENFSAAKR